MEWINVKDRLPEEGTNVIGCAGDLVRECFIMWFDDDDGTPLWGHVDWQRFGEVTHWMPLPDKPIEIDNTR